MRAIDFREKESKLNEEITEAVKQKMISLGQTEIRMVDHELNSPCINSGAPEHALHTVSDVCLHLGQVTFNIDDQIGGYNIGEIPVDSMIELLGQIEDLDEKDFEEEEDEIKTDDDGNCEFCGEKCFDGEMCDEQQADGF